MSWVCAKAVSKISEISQHWSTLQSCPSMWRSIMKYVPFRKDDFSHVLWTLDLVTRHLIVDGLKTDYPTVLESSGQWGLWLTIVRVTQFKYVQVIDSSSPNYSILFPPVSSSEFSIIFPWQKFVGWYRATEHCWQQRAPTDAAKPSSSELVTVVGEEILRDMGNHGGIVMSKSGIMIIMILVLLLYYHVYFYSYC